MTSFRLASIASLIDDGMKVIDIGTDHAYLPIYLIQKRKFMHVWASDISQKVLEQSQKNIAKYGLNEKITLYVADGLKNINESFDVAVLAGMGTHTIINILENAPCKINTLIIQSNNNLKMLREYMLKNNYTLVKEIVVEEKNKFYAILKYQFGLDKMTTEELLFGRSNNKKYLNYLLDKYSEEYKHNKKIETKNLIKKLTQFIERIPD